MKIVSDPATLADVRHAVESLCARRGMDRAACDEVGLCVNEALANVIRHAYDGATDKPIEIEATVEPEQAAIRISIRDWGNGVVPPIERATKPDPLKPGGLGLICLNRMMDRVCFTQQPDGGMLLEMTRSIDSKNRSS